MPECAFHPGVETAVSCTDCGRYICTKDMVPTAVGYKCRECGIVGRPKLGGVKPRQLMFGAAAGLAAALVLGPLVGYIRFLPWLVSMGYGVAVAEATRRGAGGHRTWEFVAIAAVASVLGCGASLLVGNLYPLTPVLAPVAAGVYLSNSRL